jgi:hypothetical protein
MIRADIGPIIWRLLDAIDAYLDENPDATPDEVAVALSYLHGCMMRNAPDALPAAKLI